MVPRITPSVVSVVFVRLVGQGFNDEVSEFEPLHELLLSE